MDATNRASKVQSAPSPRAPGATLSRRGFLGAGAAIAAGLNVPGVRGVPLFRALGGAHDQGVSDLPAGAAPEPLAVRHFPDRLHAFLWRNWELVPIDRMARVLGARPSSLVRMGRAMGLSGPRAITREQEARSYITIIRRNWHLLPYDQLLQLLGWTAQKLAYTLREDDFLFEKLGRLKPACKPLKYTPVDADTEAWERRTEHLMRAEFPEGVSSSADPLFGFVKRLSEKTGRWKRRQTGDELRFCYSYFAPYGDPLLNQCLDPYPDGYLERLAEVGVNGVWLQAVLYKLALFQWTPEISAGRETRLKNLRALTLRAAEYGIRVFLYLNEPRAMPLGFFGARPHLAGVTEGDYAALCTSQPEVRRFLTESVGAICRAVPDLGGFFTITASENLTNCWSHGGGAACPRCGGRSPAEVVAEVNESVQAGIRESGTAARLLAWDWGWEDAWAAEAIARLPREAAVMSVSEWQLSIERGGVRSEVGEYSISAIGPGPRARRHWQIARDRGLDPVAKIQAGNTWELSTVPYIPAVENVARHAENLRRAGVKGLMLGWTLGGCPSLNLEVAAEAWAGGTAEDAMQRVAARRFGDRLAPSVVVAWRELSAAFREFPFHTDVLYLGPQQLGPANLLSSGPTGYHATMTGFPYDDLDAWRAIYPPEVFIAQLDKVAGGFRSALLRLKTCVAATLNSVAAGYRHALEDECRVAEAASIHFESASLQARFVLTRRAAEAANNREEIAPHILELERVLRAEIVLARRLHALQTRDSRIGFEASNQYFYVPLDLAEKILNCRFLLDGWLPELAAKRAARGG